ncbi:MAG: cytochrome c3 family protein [Thermodesulfovibrionales bacterium]|nr:cytochrome c3 family protein [Thermodesulfovibrionales bacterium]
MKIGSICALAVILWALTAATGYAEEVDCNMCHPDLSQGAVVHPAIGMGCRSCHSGIDASETPHKMTTAFPKGLSSETADVCYSCHDKAKFYAPTIHAPVGIGICTACHNPHRSENEKLLVASKQTICFNCHDTAKFTGKKTVHDPVKAGLCLECHTAHASNNEYLIVSKGNILCRKCHPRVEKEAHAVVGFKAAGHPVRGKSDPRRKGKTFECLSCHSPHTSDWGRLFRYKAENPYELCIYCHDTF